MRATCISRASTNTSIISNVTVIRRKLGYKDIIPTWKGEQFDPDHLVGLYKKAGAKYFMSMGVHVDNFDMWNSKYQRWNAAKMGVKRDVVGEFRNAAVAHGLKFGVSDHLWMAYKWFAVATLRDKTARLSVFPTMAPIQNSPIFITIFPIASCPGGTRTAFRIPGSDIGFCASRIWWINISRTCFTATAKFRFSNGA